MAPTPSAAARRPPPRSEVELLVRAEALAGRSVGDLAAALALPLPREPRRAKGFIGALAELALGADPSAGDGPDFPALGIELKTVPLRRSGRPAESTFCCAIQMGEVDRERWERSRLRRRLAQVLWLPVAAAQEAPLAERRFGRACLWRPSAEEWELLQTDWEHLVGAIAAGRCPSAHEGRVLQVRPKAAHGRVRALAAIDGVRRVLPLGFYLRAGFTGALLGRCAEVCVAHT